MAAWKILLGLAGVLVVFAAGVTLADLDLSPWVLAGVLAFVVVSLFVSLRSYRLGQQIGTSLAEDEDE